MLHHLQITAVLGFIEQRLPAWAVALLLRAVN